jgi:pyruvate/2-oxoglutarate dehydrogenase complex dihydrolipoamide acyltransferase (E2) component
MPIEVLLPQRGMGMSEATIVRWHKAEGERVQEGEILVEVESSKVTEEIAAPASGSVSRILFAEGDQAEPGSILAIIEPAGMLSTPVAPQNESRLPIERKAPEPVSGQRLPISPIRRRTAQRLLESVQTTAQVTLYSEVDTTRTVEKRDALKSQMDISFTDIVVAVAASALRNHPRLNAVWTEDGMALQEHINIGIAVALEDGLLVPVITEADKKSLKEIHAQAEALIEKARKGDLTRAELSDGTFSVTNLGMYRIDAFTPILNPPQTAILGVGRIAKKPLVVNDTIQIGYLMGLSLTFDHRVVDGAPAAAFLDEVGAALEEAKF